MSRQCAALWLGVAGLAGCGPPWPELGHEPMPDFPGVIELGELEVVPAADLGSDGIDATFCDDGLRCAYAQVGPVAAGETGGATFTFTGTGEPVCVVIDPEAVAWYPPIDNDEPWLGADSMRYPDDPRDDGDLDMHAGPSAFYSGTPGLDVGDFDVPFVDSLGQQGTRSAELCVQDSVVSSTETRAGVATPEFCTFATVEGQGYTVLLETFSLPDDDGVLSFAALVFGGQCDVLPQLEEWFIGDPMRSTTRECLLRGESVDPATGEPREGLDALEQAYCDQDVVTACCEQPLLCGDAPADPEVCDEPTE